MAQITSQGKNYKPKPSTPSPITGAGSNYRSGSSGNITGVGKNYQSSSPAVRGGYPEETYNNLSERQRAEVDAFYTKNQPLQPGVYNERTSVGKQGGYTTTEVFNNPKLVDTYTPQRTPAQQSEASKKLQAQLQQVSKEQEQLRQRQSAQATNQQADEDNLAGYKRRISGTQERQDNFQKFEQTSKGVERMKDFSSLVTGGSGELFTEQRGIIGRTAEKTVYGLISWPMYAVPGVINAGEKLANIGEATFHKETRPNVLGGLIENVPTAATIYTKPETYTTAIVFAGLGGLSSAKTSFPVRKGMETIYPETYVPLDTTGIKFVEANTIPTEIGELRGLEGETVPTVHVTTSAPPFDEQGQFVTVAKPAGAGPTRQSLALYNFYKSSPEVNGQVYTPRAYLGYAGIKSAENAAASSGKVVYNNPTVRLLTAEETVSPTPTRYQIIQEANLYQIQQGGKTFVPAENIAGRSVEGQLINPAKYVDSSGAPIKGFENVKTEGTIIQRTGPSTYTYYKQLYQNPYTNPVARALWEVLGSKSRYYKFEIIPTEVKPATNAKAPIAEQIETVSTYLESSSAGTRSVPTRSPTISSTPMSSTKSSYSASTSTGSIEPSSSTMTSSGSITASSTSPTLISLTSTSPSPARSRGRSPPTASTSVTSSPTESVQVSPSPIYFSTPRMPYKGKVGIPPPPEQSETKRRVWYEGTRQQQYDVLVRREGRFRTFNNRGVDLKTAVKIGTTAVDTTAAASFMVVERGTKTPAQGVGQYLSGMQWRVSKRNPNVFVERNEFRINTGGEKSDIRKRPRWFG